MDSFGGIEAHWIWIGLGLILAALEILVPGVYLIWLAVAAIITGALVFGIGLALPAQIIVFVFLSLIAAFSARRFLRDQPIVSSDPLMNRRGSRLVGELALITQAIDGGTGRVKHGDSEWLARGPDLAAGTRVRIIGNDGSILIVEPFEALPPPKSAEQA
ncbi:Putative activity regulator of membrane protease YbbK [Altererythrobacter epoxidivorans]|uniref:Putative activity regulator of membrane protease YbbK n=1 Tax=Altererythrobacter epoxidivorans TaxID=361183 RepID=A0A0M4MTB4_9SPHN|nr:NfeD family protein [Altererythrobacter epoxidivorans]ALE15338.1 Putative activity regulator of membrane protease YbbK [Altererythrobacter epoxidivorans]